MQTYFPAPEYFRNGHYRSMRVAGVVFPYKVPSFVIEEGLQRRSDEEGCGAVLGALGCHWFNRLPPVQEQPPADASKPTR